MIACIAIKSNINLNDIVSNECKKKFSGSRVTKKKKIVNVQLVSADLNPFKFYDVNVVERRLIVLSVQTEKKKKNSR